MPRALVEPAPPDAPEAFAATTPTATPAEESEGAAGVPVHAVARWTLALAGVAGVVWAWSVAPLLALAGVGVGLVLAGGWLVSAPWRARRQMSRRPARRAGQSREPRPRSGGWRQRMGRVVSPGARGGPPEVGAARPGGSVKRPRGSVSAPRGTGGAGFPVSRDGSGAAGVGRGQARHGGPPGGPGRGRLPGSAGGATSTTGRGSAGPGGAPSGLARRRTNRRDHQAGRNGTGSGGMALTSSRGASQTRPSGSRRGPFGSVRRSPRQGAATGPARRSNGGRPLTSGSPAGGRVSPVRPMSGSPAGERVSTGRPTGKAGRRAATAGRASAAGAGGGTPGARRSTSTPGARPGATGRGAAPTGNRASSSTTPRQLRQPSTWFGGTPGARQRQRQHSRTTSRPGVRARNAKAKARREWRDWWLTPQEGATPPAPKTTRQPSKRRRVDTDQPVPRGKRQRRAGQSDTDPPASERETLAWVGHSDLTTELNDGPAPVDDFPFDDGGFPVHVPDRSQPPRPSQPGWTASTDESAGSYTGPATNKGVQPMSTTDIPPDVATMETARATYLSNAVAADEQTRAYASEAQDNRDRANSLAAANDTGEHDGEIARLHQLADGCESNAALRAARADAWAQEAANAFTRIMATTGG